MFAILFWEKSEINMVYITSSKLPKAAFVVRAYLKKEKSHHQQKHNEQKIPALADRERWLRIWDQPAV